MTTLTAQACWLVKPGLAELRIETVPEPFADQVRVRALHSGISRGTEALVYRGEVPSSEFERMRAPFQAGDFAGPVKYGYSSVGVVEAGPPALLGRAVFRSGSRDPCQRQRRGFGDRPAPGGVRGHGARTELVRAAGCVCSAG